MNRRPTKHSQRELTKRRQKRLVRQSRPTQTKPPFWFRRQTAEIRAAQMAKYRQMRPQPEPVQYSSWTITMSDLDYYMGLTSSGWSKWHG